VAAALGAAHAAGVVHRDLKPDNVFLSAGGSESVARGTTSAMLSDAPDVRVVDFGAAKIVGSSRMTRTGIVFGTPHYMSPEQASGAPLDHRADIYALGVIMYEMFTGRVPFEADTYMGILTQHMFVQPVPPSQVSDAAKELGALEQITLICLEKKPEDRFASMDDLVAAIDAVVRLDGRGGVDIAPRLDMPAHHVPPSVRYRMADELEPPTLEELRVAIGSDPPLKRTFRWWWLGALFGTILAILGVLAALREPSAADPSAPEKKPFPAVSGPRASATVTKIELPATPSPLPAESALSAPTPNFAVSAASAASSAPRPAARRPAPRRPAPAAIDDIGDPFTSGR
jgi:serine/threonine-protein kinase